MTNINRDTVLEIAKQGAAEIARTAINAADGNPGMAMGQMVLALAIIAKASGDTYERTIEGVRLAFKAVYVVGAKPDRLH